ncbi:hypothetical protein [Emticicia sp. C21]|uniref:hypothetical protein n=1 Tax=Emticicia sp. C21 TaxID=2302915 RepID=UPI000E352FCF|nr:hypothetical protein [Emticicia sp. C21]RFS18147.1 hypothetical protein D0T08_02565 [Emticicia sp. C21]
MTKIEHKHFIEYLNFLGTRYHKLVLPQEKLDKLRLLNDQQINQYLQLLYQKFELNGAYEERSFLNSINPIKENPEIIEVEAEELPVIVPDTQEELTPVQLPVTIPVEASPESELETKPVEQISPVRETPLSVKMITPAVTEKPTINPIPVNPAPANIPPKTPVSRESTAIKPRYKYNYWRIGIVVFIIFASIYTVYKFIAYQKLGFVYVLTDELLVRTSSDKNAKVLGSMNLFGKAKGRDNKETLTFAELKLYSNEKQGAFYKVIMSDFPFVSYLFNLDDIGYVYAKYVTTNKREQETYQKIFKPIKEDYYELKSLEFAYRAIIVNAITTQPALMQLVLSKPCDKPNMHVRNAPLRIGQYQNRDKTVFFVLVQLSDGNYYSIEGDGFYNALPAKPIYMGEDLMSAEGKFQLKGDYFVWESCDKTVSARSNRGEFDYFEIE